MLAKRKIQPLAAPSEAPWINLQPIVDALVAAGNRTVTPTGTGAFYQNRDGWRCELAEPIDFDLIRSSFELPASIHLDTGHDAILDTYSWIVITGSSQNVTVGVRPLQTEVRRIQDEVLAHRFPIPGDAGWRFRIEEVSPCVYECEGSDAWGRRVSRKGTDPDALLAQCKHDAGELAAKILPGT